MLGLFSPLGLAVIGLYLYVGVAIVKAELNASATIPVALVKAATWPLTIWSTIKKLYLTRPTM